MKITKQLAEDVSKIHHLEMEIDLLNLKLKPLRHKVMKKVDIGTHQIGDHVVIKRHQEPVPILAHLRKGYDVLTIK